MAITITLDRPGRSPLDLVALGWSAVRYSTVVSGGYASAVIVAPGDARRKTPLLGTLSIRNDDRLLFEGLVEDKEFDWDASSQSSEVTAFGKQRLLQLASVRRSWSLRSVQIVNTIPSPIGNTSDLEVITGYFDYSQPTHLGIRVRGKTIALGTTEQAGGSVVVPNGGLTPLAFLGTHADSGTAHQFSANITAWDANGVVIGSAIGPGAGDFNFNLTAVPGSVPATIQILGNNIAPATYTPADFIDFYNFRFLGTSVTEDTPGGYYAATLLRDVLSFVPGITPGQIDTGLEYVIQELDRSTRTDVKSVIDEIAAYFTREWGVWEDGRFDWTQPNLGDPGWTITLGDTISGRIKESVDGLARDTYLTYTDPTDQRQKEASYQTTRLGNDFYRNGLKSDDVEAPGLAFTPLTAALFAQAANLRNSRVPAAQGTIVVSPWKMLPRSAGGPLPALEIRAGDNISIPDFPVDDAFGGGADNQSLFHVIQVDVDLSAATVTLTIAGYLPGLDVLTARLNAATKVASS